MICCAHLESGDGRGTMVSNRHIEAAGRLVFALAALVALVLLSAGMPARAQVTGQPAPGPVTIDGPGENDAVTVDRAADRLLRIGLGDEAVAAELGVTAITATGISDEPPPGYEARPGWRLVTVGLRYTNLRQVDALAAFNVSDFTVLVEDGGYVYPVHAASAGIGSPLARPHTFLPGDPADGPLVFEVPEEAGDLALVHFTSEGALALDLTPEREPAARPVPVAGPSSRGVVMFDLLAASRRPSEVAAGMRIVVLDLELRLEVEHWDQSLSFDPSEGLELRDAEGRVYRPLASLSGLRRPLATVPLWRDQPARGEVGYEVAGDASGLTLVIPFRGNPVQLALPDGLLPVPIATVPAEEPAPPATEQPAPSVAVAEVPETPAVELPALGAAEPEEPAAERPAAGLVEEEEEAAPASEPSESTPPLPPTPIKPRPPAAPVPASACPVPNPGKGARAVFLGEDRGTSGEWQGHYGGEGQILVSYDGAGQDQSRLPPHIEGYEYSEEAEFYVWTTDTADTRAPAPLTGNRVAATVYSGGSFSLTLDARDRAPHVLALYFLDWDSNQRAQWVTLYDARTGDILDRRSLADFSGGVYFLYETQGSVRVELTSTGAHNAVMAGVFWDAARPPGGAELLLTIAKIRDRTRDEAALTVRRGESTILFTLTGEDRPWAAGREEGAPDASDPGSLVARYTVGPGYGRLIQEREDPSVAFSWWRDVPSSFPEAARFPAGQTLWAEWEGEVLLPGWGSYGTIPLAGRRPFGASLEDSESGLCIAAVEPGSPADLGGLEAGDVITRLGGQPLRITTDLAFRLEAPEGGHLFVDGMRLLANVPCGLPGVAECAHGPRLEATTRLDVGRHVVRVAAVRHGAGDDVEAEAADEPPGGPRLSWRLPEMEEFEAVPAHLFRPVPPPGTWSRSPRQAAQVGLEWLQSSAVDWQQRHGCNGCHVQAQALAGMAIARDNEYRVSDRAYDTLLSGFAEFQNDDGSWHNGAYVTATQFGAMALATAEHRGGEGRNDTLMRAVRYLLGVQEENGVVRLDHESWPIDQGDILATANARMAFSVAAGVALVDEAATVADAETRALEWLLMAEPSTNQDRAMKLLGLVTEDPAHRATIREVLIAAKADLLAHQLGDGGWEESDGTGANAFATGQALYALKVAGQSVASAPFQTGVAWLLDHQLWTGAWPQMNTHSGDASQYAPTMWPVIALVGSFQAVPVAIAHPTAQACVEGMVDLAAQVSTDEPVDSVRFVVDGVLVGTAEKPGRDGLYHLRWDSGTVAPGPHEIRIEAVRGGATRGEDQTLIYHSEGGDGCAGILSVVSIGEHIPGIAAPNIELVLDASGSMREQGKKIDGRLKIDVAKDVMMQIIRDLPDGMKVGLRVYGQRIREGREGDCRDSELVVGFGPLDRESLLRQVQEISALGTTPLAYSLVRAARDLAGESGAKLILLVTDGKEECNGSPRDVAARLTALGMKLRVDVVGFALAEEAVKQEMENVAALTGGRFFDAQDAAALQASILDSLAAPYDVIDGAGVRVTGGIVNQGAIEVPRGIYAIAIHGTSEVFTIPDVAIGYDKFTRVELVKSGPDITYEVLGPATADDADWAAEATIVPGWTPGAEEAAASPAQLALLNQALAGLEQEVVALQADRGPAPDQRIRDAQRMLRQLGFDPGPADGLWGGKTEGAVRAFQAWYPSAQLAATGQLDDATFDALSAAEAAGMTYSVVTRPTKPSRPALQGVPSVLDSGTLMVGGQIVPLLGVRGVAGEHANLLGQYIGNRAVACAPEGRGQYWCTIGEFDLSVVVLFNGGGRATADAPAYLKEAEAHAQANRLGVWR